MQYRQVPRYPGIAMQAVSLTCGVLFVMLFVYATRLIRVTDKLRTGIIAATGALCLFYFVSFLLSLFGVADSPGLQLDLRWVSASACSWSGWRRSTCCWTSTSSRRPPIRRTQVHGMVRRVRPDGHADLALSRDPPLADEARRTSVKTNRASPLDEFPLARSTTHRPLPPCWRS